MLWCYHHISEIDFRQVRSNIRVREDAAGLFDPDRIIGFRPTD